MAKKPTDTPTPPKDHNAILGTYRTADGRIAAYTASGRT